MSHFTRVTIGSLTRHDELVQALEAMGATVTLHGTVRDFFGRTQVHEVAARLPNDAGDLGFSRDTPEAPFVLTADWDAVLHPKAEVELLLRREYAAACAVTQARAAGWQDVRTVRQERGEILVLGTRP